MNVEWTVLMASALAILAFGVLMGYGLSERKRATRTRRQEAAQLFLYRQLHELRATRQRDHSTRMNVRVFPRVSSQA